MSPQAPELVGDTLGLQSIKYTKRVVSERFSPPARDDGKEIVCRAEVKVDGAVHEFKETSSLLNILGKEEMNMLL